MILKCIIEKIKNCVHVWKSRNLTYFRKLLIIKTLILALSSYEIEIRGKPEKFKKELFIVTEHQLSNFSAISWR